MHELSIAMGIVKIAEKEAKTAHAKVIESIELEIGTLSGIEIDSLKFAWPMAVNGTLLEKAEMKINIVHGIAKCVDCDHEFKIKNLFDPCPKCNSFLKIILQGKELRVKALEVS
jgi:hydrogenase nickel incorporation protein HypA/HybF